MFIDVADTNDLKDKYPVKAGNVLMDIHTFWTFEPMEAVGDVPQTAVTLTTRVDLKGKTPTILIEMAATNFLSQISDLRIDFDKSKEIEAYKENIKDGKTEDNVSNCFMNNCNNKLAVNQPWRPARIGAQTPLPKPRSFTRMMVRFNRTYTSAHAFTDH